MPENSSMLKSLGAAQFVVTQARHGHLLLYLRSPIGDQMLT